jgi:phosphate transport system substrate-binding protein
LQRLLAAGCWLLATLLIAGAVSPTRAATNIRTGTVRLVGAGSTFDYPFFNLAFAQYAKSHPVSVNYQSIGSGGGIKQYSAGTVDFGATDVPMNADELAAATRTGGATVQVPVALGGEAIVYNLPAVGRQVLKLDGPTLAAIYEGKITKWNDSAIRKLNPTISLPNDSILPVHRSDGSGTTYIFTDYLSAISSSWASNVGKGKAVAWPAGLGGKGNPGVATGVRQHTGAIGYVELAYAIDNKIPYVQLKNRAGAYVFPTQATVRAAASQFPNVNYKRFSIVNALGPTSYPIAGYSWLLLRQHPRAHAKELVDLFRWLATSGQSYAGQLKYVPLPDNVQKQALKALGSIK